LTVDDTRGTPCRRPRSSCSKYRNLKVNVVIDDPVTRVCRISTHHVQLTKYFMMNWSAGTDQLSDYQTVTQGSKDAWFQTNKEHIRTAAMGKGAPRDYELALEWAVRSKQIPVVTGATLQHYVDEHLGIDCSGFVTNYLIAAGKEGVLDRSGSEHQRRVVLQRREGGERSGPHSGR
jgi:hypothetical protein